MVVARGFAWTLQSGIEGRAGGAYWEPVCWDHSSPPWLLRARSERRGEGTVMGGLWISQSSFVQHPTVQYCPSLMSKTHLVEAEIAVGWSWFSAKAAGCLASSGLLTAPVDWSQGPWNYIIIIHHVAWCCSYIMYLESYLWWRITWLLLHAVLFGWERPPKVWSKLSRLDFSRQTSSRSLSRPSILSGSATKVWC